MFLTELETKDDGTSELRALLAVAFLGERFLFSQIFDEL